MYSNIKVYQKYLATSIKVGCATRSLYASSGPKYEYFRIFLYKFSVIKMCNNYLKILSECTILMQMSRGRPPDPHLREGVTPSHLPLSAILAWVNPSASLSLAPHPAIEALDPPMTLPFP